MIMTKNMLTITSDPINLCQVEQYLADLKCKYSICEERFSDILVSLTEAVNNAIIHGNKTDNTKMVNIATVYRQNGLVFTITDEGDGFNPDTIPNPCDPKHIHKCGGRGVHIMSHLSDKLVFRNQGRTVSLTFRRQEA